MPKLIQFSKSVKSVIFWSVISAAFIGPGTVTTCAIAGATYGLDLLWALTFATAACIVLQETVARITIASGHSLGEVIAMRYARKITKYLVAGAIVFGCAAYQAGNILGAVAGLGLIFDINNQWLTLIVVALASLALGLGNTKHISQFLGILVALMGVMFMIVATRSDFSFARFFSAALIPSFPNNAGLLVIGLVGTTIVPYNLFLGSGIGKGQEIGEMRMGIILAILIGGFISMAILVSGTIVKGEFSYSLMSEALSEQLGTWMGFFFAVGLFSAGFTSAITAPLAANITVLSVADTNDKHYHYYKFVWVGVMLVGFIFGISGVKPIPIIILAQVLNGLVLPLITIFIVLIINDKKIIPQTYRNTIFMNLALLLVVGITTFLGLSNIEKGVVSALNINIPSELSLWVMSSISLTVVLILGGLTLRK
ncbi:MAG: divalent metal cation transporter [Cytophagales bacterium]|nr:MAG: divalent metal cation transporter [Cytophagales bacterium]